MSKGRKASKESLLEVLHRETGSELLQEINIPKHSQVSVKISKIQLECSLENQKPIYKSTHQIQQKPVWKWGRGGDISICITPSHNSNQFYPKISISTVP